MFTHHLFAKHPWQSVAVGAVAAERELERLDEVNKRLTLCNIVETSLDYKLHCMAEKSILDLDLSVVDLG